VTFKLILVDFNYAKEEHKSETNIGTVVYAAPEVFGDNAANQTKKVDIWSLGAILYEM
jgi:serine/threonine protein kinase